MQGHTSEEDLMKGFFYAVSDICFHAEHTPNVEVLFAPICWKLKHQS